MRLGGLPGARRRFTGSYETGSFDPDAMPTTSWLLDPIPAADPDRWRLTVVDGTGRYQLGLDELAAAGARMRATLDCTSGWYAEQDWTGVPVSALLLPLEGVGHQLPPRPWWPPVIAAMLADPGARVITFGMGPTGTCT